MKKSIVRISLLILALVTIGAAFSCNTVSTSPRQTPPASMPAPVPHPGSTSNQTPTPKNPAKPLLPEKVILDGTILKSRFGQLELEPNGLKALEEAVKEARSSARAFTVVVSGYSSNKGPEARNIAICRHRAEFIAKALANAGIPSEKITVKAIGQDNPVADSSTRKGRLKNLRVEIEFMDH
jgi:outer membrane protein OmpA-like peptidoglycan-associated protein